MDMVQYQCYFEIFHAPHRINKKYNRMMSVLGGRKCTIGSAVIPVTFDKLGIALDITFSVLADTSLTALLST